jgi:hypothetical protein
VGTIPVLPGQAASLIRYRIVKIVAVFQAGTWSTVQLVAMFRKKELGCHSCGNKCEAGARLSDLWQYSAGWSKARDSVRPIRAWRPDCGNNTVWCRSLVVRLVAVVQGWSKAPFSSAHLSLAVLIVANWQ